MSGNLVKTRGLTLHIDQGKVIELCFKVYNVSSIREALIPGQTKSHALLPHELVKLSKDCPVAVAVVF